MDPNPSPKQARILAGAVRALNADQRRGNTAARQQSHERATKDYVVLPKMPVLDQGRPQQ